MRRLTLLLALTSGVSALNAQDVPAGPATAAASKAAETRPDTRAGAAESQSRAINVNSM